MHIILAFLLELIFPFSMQMELDFKVELSKGQSISKCLFWCFQFSQKTNLKTQIFALAYLGGNFSFIFWENWKKSKFPFEIKWPLLRISLYSFVYGRGGFKLNPIQKKQMIRKKFPQLSIAITNSLPWERFGTVHQHWHLDQAFHRMSEWRCR